MSGWLRRTFDVPLPPLPVELMHANKFRAITLASRWRQECLALIVGSIDATRWKIEEIEWPPHGAYSDRNNLVAIVTCSPVSMTPPMITGTKHSDPDRGLQIDWHRYPGDQ